jgi:hypothetical protein
MCKSLTRRLHYGGGHFFPRGEILEKFPPICSAANPCRSRVENFPQKGNFFRIDPGHFFPSRGKLSAKGNSNGTSTGYNSRVTRSPGGIGGTQPHNIHPEPAALEQAATRVRFSSVRRDVCIRSGQSARRWRQMRRPAAEVAGITSTYSATRERSLSRRYSCPR